MNIFVLDSDPVEAARLQCDQHVIKMTLETAQILSTVGVEYLRWDVPSAYKPTHVRHPCVLWALESGGNLDWLFAHGLALASEYTRRYNRVHKSEAVIQDLLDFCYTVYVDDESDLERKTPFVKCMPGKYKTDREPWFDYRDYYRAEKLPWARFRLGKPESWSE